MRFSGSVCRFAIRKCSSASLGSTADRHRDGAGHVWTPGPPAARPDRVTHLHCAPLRATLSTCLFGAQPLDPASPRASARSSLRNGQGLTRALQQCQVEHAVKLTLVAPVRSLPRILTAAPTLPEVVCVSTNGPRPTDRLKIVPQPEPGGGRNCSRRRPSR